FSPLPRYSGGEGSGVTARNPQESLRRCEGPVTPSPRSSPPDYRGRGRNAKVADCKRHHLVFVSLRRRGGIAYLSPLSPALDRAGNCFILPRSHGESPQLGRAPRARTALRRRQGGDVGHFAELGWRVRWMSL